jgi:hypothetical protein
MKSAIKFVVCMVVLSGAASVFCAAVGPAARNGGKVQFPGFAQWSSDQRCQEIPEELINDEQYAQTLRKMVQAEHPGIVLPKYRDFAQDVQGGEEAINAAIRDNKTIGGRMIQSRADFYKRYLGQKATEFDRAAARALGDITFEQAYELTKHLPNVEDRVPSLRGSSGNGVFVRMLTGNNIRVDVNSATTLNDIKRAVQEKGGIPVDRQRIISSGKVAHSVKDLGNILYGREKLHVVAR